jgi:hypothetical protein
MSRRVLLLGVTGVDKSLALNQLKEYKETLTTQNFNSTDFMKQFIEPEIELRNFLDSVEDRQRYFWQRGWQNFAKQLPGPEEDAILSLHGVLVRPLYGVRTPIDLESLKQFHPDTIITLIDDVYMMWHRTNERAALEESVGRPTLEQLLTARRAELFLGDIIRNHCEVKRLNTLIAVNHPARVLDRLLFGPAKLKRVYLSFPISGPRKDLDGGDDSGMNQINAFLRQAAAFEEKNPGFVFFCPLTIDELPLLKLLKGSEGSEMVEFNTANRWDVRRFWGEEMLLTSGSDAPMSLQLSRDDVDRSEGLIRADVATRDYRLVMQSDSLVVFNPWYAGKETRGVGSEIRCALFHNIPVKICQDEKAHDPNGQAKKQLKKQAGSIGAPRGSEYIQFYDTTTELFKSLQERRK